MIYYLILSSFYFIGLLASIALIVSLKPFKDEYIAKRIVFLPISLILQKSLLLLVTAIRISTGTIPPLNNDFAIAVMLLAIIGAMLPATTMIYLAGVFAGLWNGIGKFVPNPKGTIISNESGLILAWNQGASQIFGYSSEEVLGKPITLIMPERYKTRHLIGFKTATQNKNYELIDKPLKLEGLHKNGSMVPIILQLSRLELSDQSYFTAEINLGHTNKNAIDLTKFDKSEL